LHDIHVAGVPFNGRRTVVPCQLLEAADRLSCDTTLIGAIPGDLNFPLKTLEIQWPKKTLKFFARGNFLLPARAWLWPIEFEDSAV
jgi:hypothetical protein